MDNKIKKKIEKFVDEFIKKTTFNTTFEVEEDGEGNIMIDLTTDEPQALIGEEGQTLWDIQFIFNRIFRRMLFEDLGQETRVEVDINKYKQNKIRYLKELAQEIANKVALFKKEECLPVLNSYERRIVHTELSARTDVVTESVGKDEERRLVIKPVK